MSARFTDHRFSVDGEVIRVVVAGDVLALPHSGWSYSGFGQSISVDWLLTQPRQPLPGKTKARRELLARCLVQALDAHHDPDRVPGTRAPTCRDRGCYLVRTDDCPADVCKDGCRMVHL